ncbi:general transcription factor 3c polypeptide 3 [Citrus sinensis]|uniref:General transcription factor 3c polypeptide 3 n=2 Tax=Citrus sinensis TaxID=2711 RepID=A0ACB8M9U3_CITSI|nr:general transcription factor 3c polypeptide 3 [Citrus sinensis]
MEEEMNDYEEGVELENDEVENDNEIEVEDEEEEEAGAGGRVDGDGEEEEEYVFRFKSGVNPLEWTENETSGLEAYQQFERLEYEALADRKRKAIAATNTEEDVAGTSVDAIMELINYGGYRKKTRKLNKKRGRRKGSKNKLSPGVTKMLGEASLQYAYGNFEQAISLLKEVVRLSPNLPETYNTLGLAHSALGNHKSAFDFYVIAAHLSPKDSALWKQLLTFAVQKGDTAQAMYYIRQAIRAEPKDISLRIHLASFYVEIGDYEKAAESYEQIQKLFPDNVDATKTGAQLFLKCGQTARSMGILEEYLKVHPSDADLSVIDLLVAILMENNAYEKTLQHIEHAQIVRFSGKELPLKLKVKAGICYLRLGNMEKAEILFADLQWKNAIDHADLITEVADTLMSLGHSNSALKYYHFLETNAGTDNGYLYLKLAECYLSLKERAHAIMFFYKALDRFEDNIDARLTLASLLLEEAKEEEAITLLSPPKDLDSLDMNSDKSNPWWLNEKIIMKLCHIYRAKGMPEDFVDAIFPLVCESLCVEALRQKVKVKRRLTKGILQQRTKIYNNLPTDSILCGIRPAAPKSELLVAARARKKIQKKEALKEEKKALAKAAGVEWHSDDTDDESQQEAFREPPLPNLLKNEENQCLIIDLCKALASLQRYEEASEIINLSMRLAYNILPLEKKEELRSLGAKMAYDSTDPNHGFDCAKYILQLHPYSLSAWNCYYKVLSRMGKINSKHSKHSKFIRYLRAKYKDCVPPIIISGHQFTMASHHQDAARCYLEAYKLLPENPLINLCVGSALINLALGFRLQNKHQCLAQGFAFLYNNLRLCEHSQEALYNIARACHHVGLVSLAASYYEKVLAIKEKDYPIPKHNDKRPDLMESGESGYCDLRREAAYNLHLIYKNSGAVDLARQLLKDYCTF